MPRGSAHAYRERTALPMLCTVLALSPSTARVSAQRGTDLGDSLIARADRDAALDR
jgi:hypothetical protein